MKRGAGSGQGKGDRGRVSPNGGRKKKRVGKKTSGSRKGSAQKKLGRPGSSTNKRKERRTLWGVAREKKKKSCILNPQNQPPCPGERGGGVLTVNKRGNQKRKWRVEDKSTESHCCND